MSDTTNTLLGIIPVALVGGMLMRFTDHMMPEDRRGYYSGATRRTAPRRRSESLSAKRARHNRLYGFGNFSNVGF